MNEEVAGDAWRVVLIGWTASPVYPSPRVIGYVLQCLELAMCFLDELFFALSEGESAVRALALESGHYKGGPE